MERATEYTADLQRTVNDLKLYIGDLNLAVQRAERQLSKIRDLERSLDHQRHMIADVIWSEKKDMSTQFSESMVTENISDDEEARKSNNRRTLGS